MGRRAFQPVERSTISVVHAHTQAGVTPLGNVHTGVAPDTSIALASGALTANTLKSMLSITGAGRMPLLTIYTADATARTLRIKVTVDGISAVDVTSASVAATGSGLIICGEVIDTIGSTAHEIKWAYSLAVEIASSVTETDKVSIRYAYELEQ